MHFFLTKKPYGTKKTKWRLEAYLFSFLLLTFMVMTLTSILFLVLEHKRELTQTVTQAEDIKKIRSKNNSSIKQPPSSICHSFCASSNDQMSHAHYQNGHFCINPSQQRLSQNNIKLHQKVTNFINNYNTIHVQNNWSVTIPHGSILKSIDLITIINIY